VTGSLFAPLDRSFFARRSAELAPELLGLWLLRAEPDGAVSGGPIVETEAYGGPEDEASHARFGRTRRNRVMFGTPGHAYVFLVYGMHHLLNVVSETDGDPGAVLIRAIRPVLGIDRVRARRGRSLERAERLAAGPARVSQALGVDLDFDGVDLSVPGPLWIAHPEAGGLPEAQTRDIVSGPRVGIDYAGEAWKGRPWRFGVPGDPALSRPFPSLPARVAVAGAGRTAGGSVARVDPVARRESVARSR
jgi:DNA-3-methyladenine glycosylase